MTLERLSGLLVALATCAVPCACGGSSNASPPSSPADAGDAGDGEAGFELDAGPAAFAIDMPQIVANQGVVLAHPTLITITWPAQDPNALTWEALDDGIGTSGYWPDTTSEYGVGTPTSGPADHVHMSGALPAVVSYDDLTNYVVASLQRAGGGPVGDAGSSGDAGQGDAGSPDASPDDAAMMDAASPDASDVTQPDVGDGASPPPAVEGAWPAPIVESGRVQSIYALFIPETTSVTDPSGASFCEEGALGYHDNVVVGGAAIPYAVILQCPPIVQLLQSSEETVSHELVEATTNPYPSSTTSLGYIGFDADHVAWDIYTGYSEEVADACQNWADSYFQEAEPFPYWVQRVWSNAEAKAGHDPCVPKPSAPYQGMTLFPAQEVSVTADLTSVGYAAETTKGFVAKIGQPVTFQVGFYSDAPTAPWTISYDFPSELAFFNGQIPVRNGSATVTIDKTSGQNGDVANVTVTSKTKGDLPFQIMAITWNPPKGTLASIDLPHYLPILLSNE